MADGANEHKTNYNNGSCGRTQYTTTSPSGTILAGSPLYISNYGWLSDIHRMFSSLTRAHQYRSARLGLSPSHAE